MNDAPEQPVLRVVTPGATEEEIAALVAVLSSLGSAEPEPAPASEWAAAHRRLRRNPPHGPGGWRASALPR